MNEQQNAFFERFVAAKGLPADTKAASCWYFCLDERSAHELVELVIHGNKRATSSSLLAYQIDGEDIPKVGDYNLITEFSGEPRCVIMTTAVTVCKYKEITWDMAQREGEDECLESWQNNHEKFFKEDGRRTGFIFSDEMPVIFEEFTPVYTE